MQANSYRKRPSKAKAATPNLKLVAGAGARPRQLRAGGLEPTGDMEPGIYVAMCESGTITTKGRSTIAVLQFRLLDGEHGGTGFASGSRFPTVDGIVPLGSRYARQCAIALGHEIEPGDNLDPGSIFGGQIFSVSVGYRMTEKIGGSATAENTRRRKDAKDFLRVHEIIARGELP